MTSSPQPWTVKLDYTGNDKPPTACLRDATGKVIGFFSDARDAEAIVEQFQENGELLAHIDQLEETFGHLLA